MDSAEKIQNLKGLNANTFDLGVQGVVVDNNQHRGLPQNDNPFGGPSNAFNPYQQQ